MNRTYPHNKRERGMATLEFAFVAAIYLTMLVALVAGGALFWSHNALVDATRRGTRYAAMQCYPCDTCCTGNATAIARIKNVVVFGNPGGTGQPLIPRLQTSNVKVQYYNDAANSARTFGVTRGSVAVSICQSDESYTAAVCPVGGNVAGSCTGYRYNYLINRAVNLIQMPEYRTTLTGESAGFVPADKL